MPQYAAGFLTESPVSEPIASGTAPAATKAALPPDDPSSDELSDEYLIAENHMVIGNFGGLPSMTLPMGFKDDLPIGINITCNAFKEEEMFDIALAIEDITGLKGHVKEVL